MYITNNAALAKKACSAGVSRIFVDWETMGKAERQGHLDSVQSNHSLSDLIAVREAIPEKELMVRINPINEDTRAEVEAALGAGADLIMLPMFYDYQAVKQLSDIVAGRAKIVPLFETVASLSEVEKVCLLDNVREIYVGLNDLHIELKDNFMFSSLAAGLVDNVAEIAYKNNVRFGFGGIARVSEGSVSGGMVLGEHIRLNSNIVILSRTFYRADEGTDDAFEVFFREIELLNDEWQRQVNLSKEQQQKNHDTFKNKVTAISNALRKAKIND